MHIKAGGYLPIVPMKLPSSKGMTSSSYIPTCFTSDFIVLSIVSINLSGLVVAVKKIWLRGTPLNLLGSKLRSLFLGQSVIK